MFNKISHDLLAKYSDTFVGIEKELVSKRFGGLTVVSGSVGSGKDTLLAGIALHFDPQNCLVVFTETRPEDSVLGKVANSFLHYTYGVFSIDDILVDLSNTTCTEIFIQQYMQQGWSDTDQHVKDLDKLRKFCTDSGKNIYIGVHARKVFGNML